MNEEQLSPHNLHNVCNLGNLDALMSDSICTCTSCGAKFTHTKSLRLHTIAMHTKTQCRICKKECQNRYKNIRVHIPLDAFYEKQIKNIR